MRVSWEWLAEYFNEPGPRRNPRDYAAPPVAPASGPLEPEKVGERLAMAGLNLEGIEVVAGDKVLDIEVTSNRADCLSHLGIARELAALIGAEVHQPLASPANHGPPAADSVSVRIDAAHLCRRFTARLIRGVRIGPSPGWLQRRLMALDVAIINNVVDVTNYVLLECGQPLHAYDADLVRGRTLIAREPRPGEKLQAINHQTYALEPGMCVIADAERAVGLGGVMGGASTEVSPATRDVLVEAAWFDPVATRSTARRLNLHSPASFRFERGIDPQGVDWASRRCCELILELAGGMVAPGVVDVGVAPPEPPEVTLRYAQLLRLLGVEVPPAEVKRILCALGFEWRAADAQRCTVRVPTWRSDVWREPDLVEEVGRVYGYHHVPDQKPIAMVATARRATDRVLDRVRRALTAAGFDEAMTSSVVPAPWAHEFSPWSDQPPLRLEQPMVGILEKATQPFGAADHMRRSLVPSLLEARRINEYKANTEIDLFEVARVYLPSDTADQFLPTEPLKIGLVGERDFAPVKGVVQDLVDVLGIDSVVSAVPWRHPWLDGDRACRLFIGDNLYGFIGELSPEGRKRFGLRRGGTVAELDAGVLERRAVLVPQACMPSPFPAITRDFNFIVDHAIQWDALRRTVAEAAAPWLESVRYRETFIDLNKDGPGKKRLMLSVILRSADETLTNQQAEQVSERILRRCREQHGAQQVS